MNVRIGCDIVHLKRFEKISKETRERVFHPSELKNANSETLAGIFAAKESCKKVFNDLDWHDIEVKRKKNGRPELIISTKKPIVSHDLSIAHDGEYVMATAIFLMSE